MKYLSIRKLLIVALSAGLTACQLTQGALQAEQQQDQEHEIAAQIQLSCEQQGEDVAGLFDCDSAEQGVIPISHPAEELEISLEDESATLPDPVIDDLWQKIRDKLYFAVPDDRRVDEQRNWYLKHPEYMQRVVKRAKPFLYLIVNELEQQNMPMELVLLPIVESAFDPFAYSHGRAAGMWQFIPGTATRFGLKQTWWYDGRRDVMASTTGAINYLTYLRDMFNGNWLHALAAYNSGEGRVQRAIKKNLKEGKPTDFWSLDLPRETRAYVPKLLALVDILRNSETYSFEWPLIDNYPVTQLVDTGSQIDLAFAADLAGLTVEELHALNPGYNRWATDPNGPHKLLLPVDSVEQFMQSLENTDDKQRLNWVRHKVKNGDSLLKLSKQYHTTADVIAQVNNIKGNMIRVGDFLLIPVALKSMDYYSLSQEQRLESTQSTKHGTYQLKHTVRNGDTMWDISREYKVSVRDLAKWNAMAPTDPLYPGKTLVVWVNKVSNNQNKGAVMRSLTYTVRNGDSLARIADKFNVRIDDIQKWNQIAEQKYLQPGQKLKIYVDVTRT
jgi:membrane-bound lytic murein transglycosylase D